MLLITQLCPTLCDSMDCSPPGSSVHGDSPGKNTGVGSMPSTRGSSQPRDQTEDSALQEDSLPPESEGKPDSTTRRKMFPVTILTHLVCHSKVGVWSTIFG